MSNVKLKTLAARMLAAACLFGTSTHAAVRVLACEPEWQSLAEELGGDKVQASSATTALQDPHRIEPRPGLIARARNADLLVCTGLDLEIGWLPVLLQQSGNGRVTPGQPGYFETGSLVPRLGVPSRVDRSEGDVHPYGNPHIQLDPHNIALIASALSKRLADIDPANAAVYQQRLASFMSHWNAAMARWEREAVPLRGVAVVEHHKNSEYLFRWLGIRLVGTLEPKPGVEPSAAHLSELLAQLQRQPAKMVVRAAYQDARASLWLSERAHIPVAVLPFTVGADAGSRDLFGLFDETLQRLLDANR
jgi:zinc/manganese transport system substrate-binding protein